MQVGLPQWASGSAMLVADRISAVRLACLRHAWTMAAGVIITSRVA
jgi:hypothetical protein